MCYCYWPTTEGDVKIYGHISVKLLTEEKYGYCDSRKFEISEDHLGVEGAKTAFTVTQLHFLQWPEHGTLPVTSSLVELMDNVNRVQMRAGNKPMIVMCKYVKISLQLRPIINCCCQYILIVMVLVALVHLSAFMLNLSDSRLKVSSISFNSSSLLVCRGQDCSLKV